MQLVDLKVANIVLTFRDYKMKSKKCPFCKKLMTTNLCFCGAYKVVPGHEDKKYKDQPYDTVL